MPIRELARDCLKRVTTPGKGHALGLLKQELHSTLVYFMTPPAPIAHDTLSSVQRGLEGSEFDSG